MPRRPSPEPLPPFGPPPSVRASTVVVTTESTTRTVPAAATMAETRTVWLTNPNGSRSSVTLKAADGGMWMGPRGEYYDTFPTDEQLLPIYGLMAAKTAPAPVEEKPQTVWLTNPNGSRTPVELKPAGGGMWEGPKGEVYDGLPTVEQLEPVYGLK